MDPIQALMLSYIILGFSYFKTGLRESDWGNFPHGLKIFMMLCIFIAYLSNIIFVVKANSIADTNTKDVITLCIMIHFALQLLFIPFMRSNCRELVISLLIVNSIPMIILAGIGIRMNRVMGILGVLTMIHVVFNDAILFGFLH